MRVGAMVAAMVCFGSLATAEFGDVLQRIVVENADRYEQFGTSVAGTADYFLIGAPGDDEQGHHAGAAYLYDGATGELRFKLLPDDGAPPHDLGNRVAASPFGAVVASDSHHEFGQYAGIVFVYDPVTGERIWKLAPHPPATRDFFGTSVSVDGRLLAVGAPGADDVVLDGGAVFLYDLVSGELLRTFTASDARYDDGFGVSVALHGGKLVVGASQTDETARDSGSVYVFDVYSGRELWQFAPLPEIETSFGYEVAAGERFALVGAPYDTVDGVRVGSVTVYDIVEGRYLYTLRPDDTAEQHRFGWWVAVDGHRGLIGSPWLEGARGMVTVFDLRRGVEDARVLGDEDEHAPFFGCSFGVFDGRLLVGARGSDMGRLPETGSAYVLDYPAAGSVRGDFDGDGCVGTRDLALLLESWGGEGGDLDGDGVTGASDLAEVLSAWSECW